MKVRTRKKQTYVGSKLEKVFKVIGIIVVVFLMIGIVVDRVESYVPFNLVYQAPLNNPKPYTTEYTYSEARHSSDWKGIIKLSSSEIYEYTGMQLYLLQLYVPEGCKSDVEFSEYAKQYIKDHIDDPYGMYIVTSEYPDSYEGRYQVSWYGHVLYGDEAQRYITTKVSKIYSAAHNRFYRSTHVIYNDEEAAAAAMALTGYRMAHPFVSTIKGLLKLGIYLLIIGAILYGIHRINKFHRQKEILETPIDDLIKESLEDREDQRID